MNPDTRRILSNQPSHDNNPYYRAATQPAGSRPWGRVVVDGSFVVPAVLLVLPVVYQTCARAANWPPVLELVWYALVWILPDRLLISLDDWLHPPLFPLPPRANTAADPILQTPARMTYAAKSEILRRILGMHKGGGIMASVSQAGRRGLTSLSSSPLGSMLKGAPDQPPGLGNLDNSCYQNSILQGLAALRSLPTYLASAGVGRDEAGQGQRETTRTTDTLHDLIAKLNDMSNNGTTLWTPGVLKNMSTWQQQDAQEYFSRLLDEIDKEIGKAARRTQKPAGLENSFAADYGCGSSKDDSTASQHSDDSGYQSMSTHSKSSSEQLKFVRNPLEGLAAQRVACVACGYSEGLSLVPFNCLTLNLGTDQVEHDLFERLDNYTKVEPIPGVECAKCTLLKFRNRIVTIIERNRAAGRKDEEIREPFLRLATIKTALENDDFDDDTLTKTCKIPVKGRVSSTKTKQTVVARPPQSLAVHMNRSVFDETTGAMWKNLAAVKFPQTLDLGPWCLGSADTLTGHISEKDDGGSVSEDTVMSAQNTEHWLLDPTISMVAGDLHPSKITGPLYELRAVITHYGRHENGHYVCYRQHPRDPHDVQDNGHHILPKASKAPAQLVGEGGQHQHHLSNDVESDNDDKTLVQGEDGSKDRTIDGDANQATLVGASGAEPPQAEKAPDNAPENSYPSSQWWRLSDQDVTRVDEETVLAQGGVFMLFYDCVDPNMVLTSDIDAFVDSLESPETSNLAAKEPSQADGQDRGEVPGNRVDPSPDMSGTVGSAGLSVAHKNVGGDQDVSMSGSTENIAILASSTPLPDGDDEGLA